jgi:hypothetical protein
LAVPCSVPISSLPVLTDCPSDSEYVLFIGATGGATSDLAALRSWSTIKQCIVNSIEYVFEQFTVGDVDSPMNAGDTVLIINQAGVIEDSVFITLGSGELPRDNAFQISYDVKYNTPMVGQTQITFNQAVQNMQLYILHYSFLT